MDKWSLVRSTTTNVFRDVELAMREIIWPFAVSIARHLDRGRINSGIIFGATSSHSALIALRHSYVWPISETDDHLSEEFTTRRLASCMHTLVRGTCSRSFSVNVILSRCGDYHSALSRVSCRQLLRQRCWSHAFVVTEYRGALLLILTHPVREVVREWEREIRGRVVLLKRGIYGVRETSSRRTSR